MVMLKRYLTDEEQRRLLQVMKKQEGLLAQRDHAWVRLLIETGMRVNELATLTRAQAEAALADGWLVVTKEQRKGKRRGHAYCVTEPVRHCLEKLLDLQAELSPALLPELDQPAPLLWGRCGMVGGKLMCSHMSVRSLQSRMKHWAEQAGLGQGVSPHWMRHTRGRNIVKRSRGKNPLKVVQTALGHESISSTGIYLQMAREEFEQEMRHIAGGRVPKAQALARGAAL